MKTIKSKQIFKIVLVVPVLFFVLQIFLPPYTASQIQQHIEEHTQYSSGVKIEVDVFPAWKIFYNRADKVTIMADKIQENDLLLENIRAEYNNIFIRDMSIIGENTALQATISQESLNKYLQNWFEDLEGMSIVLNPGEVYLNGNFKVFETEINFQLIGDFEIRNQDNIFFIVESVQLEDVKISRGLIESFFEDLDPGFYFSLEKLEFPLKIDEINVLSGEIQLLGGSLSGEMVQS